MAHVFDTGLARAQRTLIRDGVVLLLSGLLRANGGYLQAVIPWGGVIRGYTDEVGIDLLRAELTGRAPAIAVALGDRVSEPAGQGGFVVKGAIELTLYHYANHLRSLTAGRTAIDAAALANDTLDPGLDVMLEHAEELVIGQRVGAAAVTNPVGETKRSTPSIKHIVPTREEELATDKTNTLWAQRFAVQVDRVINPKRSVVQMLEELRAVVRPSEVPDNVDPNPLLPGEQVLEVQNLPNVP